MQLTEQIETINQRLIDIYGIDIITGLPIWRIVWAPDQFEKRLSETTDSGVFLLQPEVRLLPKYPWIIEKYILERLVLVPEINQKELAGNKISYECMWVFMDKNENYLPPHWEVAQIVIDTVYAALGKKSLKKYRDPDADCVEPEVAIAKQKAKIDTIVNELFGDESGLGGSLVHGEGVAMPQEYRKTKES